MDATNANLSDDKIKSIPQAFYGILGLVVILIICMFLILFDVNLSSFSSVSKSQEEMIGDIFIILFFSLILVGICVIFLPNMKDFKELFAQIGNVTYVILFTIFTILFYTMINPDVINSYFYIINPIMLAIGGWSFYKALSDNYIEKFNINYERIKMLIIIFCLITLMITIYNLNPGGNVSNLFGYSLLITILISVFGLLYLIALMTLDINNTKTNPNLLSNYSSLGKYGSIFFILFLVFMTGYISYNKDSFFANKEKSAGVIILLLVISILSSILLSSTLFSNTPKNMADINKMDIFKKSLLILFGLVIAGLVIFWITYNIENLSSTSGTVNFILNLLLLLLLLGLILKTLNVKMPTPTPTNDITKNAFIASIPGLISSNKGSLLVLLASIGLLVAYFNTPSLFNYFSTQGGNQLVNKPVYTDTEYNLGSYVDLQGSETYDYQFAISCWVFIDSAPPNTNTNYTKFTSLLNFGNKPNILYNASKRTLLITMQQKNLKEITNNKLIDFDEEGNRIIYKNTNFLLQKWNNIIINYNGGTLDIFINGQLVKSSNEVVPYYTFDNLTIGENDGIKGGICNVVYFRKPLTSSNIYYIYNSVKHRSPPVLNDSNATIIK